MRGQNKRKKAKHLAGFEPRISYSQGVRSTAALQPLPSLYLNLYEGPHALF